MIEVEFGWQIRPFEYIHLKASTEDLDQVDATLVKYLASIHSAGVAAISGSPTAAAPVANPDRVQVKSAQDLIKDELGGKVVETTTVVPPWQREKPATGGTLFDN